MQIYQHVLNYRRKLNKMVKKEIDCSNQVLDRKPVRRRMARDIYFVFEEGKKKCSKIRGSIKSKSKFGHLKVGEVHKNGAYNAKNLLYSVKKKGKCFVNANYSVKQNTNYHRLGSQLQFPVSHLPIAKVNPIFVWVKQDDTRIVEVRCEDYDKRNRIRLTKTLNGWRATPRTDPSSSRVVKLVPKTLRKVPLDTSSADNKNLIQTQLSKPKDKQNYSCDQTDDVNHSKNLDFKVKLKVTPENEDSQKFHKCIQNNNFKTSVDELYETNTQELQLCPETGLFIPKIREDFEEDFFRINRIIIDLEDSDILGLKAKTDTIEKDKDKTLSYLLEETNSLQNCSNNESSGSELINSLVKNSFFGQNCSNDASSSSDLINSIVKDRCDNNANHCYDENVENFNNFNEISKKILPERPVSEILSNKIPASDSSECPNLNEVAEIEGLNIEIFQNEVADCPDVNEAIEIEDLNVDLLQDDVPECTIPNEANEIECFNVDVFRNGISGCHSFSETARIDDLNADLFQTGTFLGVNKELNVKIPKEPKLFSDILPDHNKYHIVANESPSNFSDESPEDLSYRKMEGICHFSELQNKYPNISSNPLKSCSRSEHILQHTPETITNIYKQFSKLAPFNSLQTSQIEPVNLEKTKKSDCSDDMCSNCFDTTPRDIFGEEPIQKRVRSSYESKNQFKIKIQNDPDPLTQLNILIHNSQWKLPDPILVPRERLGAILSSPAREIPLLLTTRPELRLPEAFSHPEILKNPNILVISIAQLAGILRFEMESKIRSKNTTDAFPEPFSTSQHEEKNQNTVEKMGNYDFSNYNESESMNCSQVDACFESDLNNARLAILNKMLLLPYSYGHLPSDVLQLFREEVMGQKNANNSYFLSLYNQQFPKSTTNEIYDKNINESMNLKQNDLVSEGLDNPNRDTELLPSIELPMLEELLQSKMQRLNSINSIISEIDENIVAASNKPPCLNQKTFAVLTSHKDFKRIKESIMKNNSLSNVMSKCNSADKSSFVSKINNNVDLSNITLYKNLRNHQKNVEYKPKLTCKSLSNLIYPENIKHTTVPLVNLITSNDNYFCKYGEHENIIQNQIEKYSSPSSVSTNCTHNSVSGVTSEKTHTNAALWHPIFGSTNKNGYCSPWQWTTITSPSE